MAAAPGDSLFAKAILSTVSVVKADRVQGRAATNHVRREISISVAALNGFGEQFCYLFVGLYVWKNDTALSEK